MKLVIPQPDLAHGLAIAARAASPRSTLPVLANVLLEAGETGLQISATDLEISLSVQVPARVEKPGAISIPARAFADLVNTLPDQDVSLSLKKEKLELVCGSSKTAFNGVPAAEFPPLPEIESGQGLSLPAPDFKNLLQRVVFAASSDDSRPVLTGVLLAVEGQRLILAAADGFRLSECSLALETPVTNPQSYLVPAKALSELTHILGDAERVTLCAPKGRGQIAFVLPGCTLVSQLIEGNFPDYQQIIPKRHEMCAVIPTAELLKACKQAEIFARENGRTAHLRFKPGLVEVSGHSDESGSTGASVAAQITGPEIEIAFNVVFLREALSLIRSPSVAFEAIAPTSPGLFRPVGEEGFLHVIMPVHLGT